MAVSENLSFASESVQMFPRQEVVALRTALQKDRELAKGTVAVCHEYNCLSVMRTWVGYPPLLLAGWECSQRSGLGSTFHLYHWSAPGPDGRQDLRAASQPSICGVSCSEGFLSYCLRVPDERLPSFTKVDIFCHSQVEMWLRLPLVVCCCCLFCFAFVFCARTLPSSWEVI